MYNNVFIFTGFACNGKTSLISYIKSYINNIYPNKQIIVVKEHVQFGFNSQDIITSVSELFYNNVDMRQHTFLATSLAQLDIIKQLMNNENIIVLCDRCLLDTLIFSFRNNTEVIRNSIKLYYNVLKKFRYFYLLPPENLEILEHCMERKDRKATISLDTYFENEKIFRETYKKIVDIECFPHPADDSSVKFQIINNIINSVV